MPLVLNIDHFAQAILVMGNPVTQGEVLYGKPVRLGLG